MGRAQNAEGMNGPASVTGGTRPRLGGGSAGPGPGVRVGGHGAAGSLPGHQVKFHPLGEVLVRSKHQLERVVGQHEKLD